MEMAGDKWRNRWGIQGNRQHGRGERWERRDRWKRRRRRVPRTERRSRGESKRREKESSIGGHDFHRNGKSEALKLNIQNRKDVSGITDRNGSLNEGEVITDKNGSLNEGEVITVNRVLVEEDQISLAVKDGADNRGTAIEEWETMETNPSKAMKRRGRGGLMAGDQQEKDRVKEPKMS